MPYLKKAWWKAVGQRYQLCRLLCARCQFATATAGLLTVFNLMPGCCGVEVGWPEKFKKYGGLRLLLLASCAWAGSRRDLLSITVVRTGVCRNLQLGFSLARMFCEVQAGRNKTTTRMMFDQDPFARDCFDVRKSEEMEEP